MVRKCANGYVYDGLGSVVGEVDVNGTLLCQKKADVYGINRGNVGTALSRHGFVGSLGHYGDDETGLVYMRARYYDPSIGRFTSEDPKADGINWFVYCKSDSVNLRDRSGETSGSLGDTESAVEGGIEADGEGGGELNFLRNAKGQIANFSKAKWYNSADLKGQLFKRFGLDDVDAGELIHILKEYEMGPADDMGLDKYGGLWTKTGEFLGFVEDM